MTDQSGPASSGAGAVGGPPAQGKGLRVVALLAAVVVCLALGAAVARLVRGSPSTRSTTSPTVPRPVQPGGSLSTDPDQASLRRLILQQDDVAAGMSVQLLPDGDGVAQAATLDLCNGTYPSEKLRTARLQVAAADDQGMAILSTEAVLYQNSAATAQAFAELERVAATCPSTPVPSPVGEPTIQTTFNPAPDASWAQTGGVERQAYDLVSSDGQSPPRHSVAVYLRRGRALLGIYFAQPDAPQQAVAGQTTMAGITKLLSDRLAQLPEAVVNGTAPPVSST